MTLSILYHDRLTGLPTEMVLDTNAIAITIPAQLVLHVVVGTFDLAVEKVVKGKGTMEIFHRTYVEMMEN